MIQLLHHRYGCMARHVRKLERRAERDGRTRPVVRRWVMNGASWKRLLEKVEAALAAAAFAEESEPEMARLLARSGVLRPRADPSRR